jgi:putative transcriptional regulator
VLTPAASLAKVNTIKATAALAKCGISVLAAKRGVESMLRLHVLGLHLPDVPDFEVLRREMEAHGVRIAARSQGDVDVRSLREASGLSQSQFAATFGIDEATLQNWEQGRSRPDGGAMAYLKTIARDPKVAALAQFDSDR